MARRRYLSTEISIDKAVNRLAREHGDFAALLYTWMIPHAEDDATLTGDPEELMLSVVPGRRDKDVADVEAALAAMHDLGLIIWHREAKIVEFPPASFYKYQTYIARDKRRTTPISTQQRETPELTDEQRAPATNAASPSPSPSPSPTQDDDDRAPAREESEAPDPKTECLALIARRRPDWILSGERYREFLSYEDRLPWDVIRTAVDKTLAAGARDLKYCLRILEGYVEQRVQTVADVQALDAEFERRKLQRARDAPSRDRGGHRSNVILRREKKDDSYYEVVFKRYDDESPPEGSHRESWSGDRGRDHEPVAAGTDARV